MVFCTEYYLIKNLRVRTHRKCVNLTPVGLIIMSCFIFPALRTGLFLLNLFRIIFYKNNKNSNDSMNIFEKI